MKLLILAAATTAALFALPVSEAQAHGGGLNREGCHNDRQRGTYHCHGRVPDRAGRRRGAGGDGAGGGEGLQLLKH